MAPVPDAVPDVEAVLAGDIMSTGFGAVEAGGIRAGDAVAVFAQGPVGLCATAGARALGAGLVVAVEGVPERREMAMRLGANVVLHPGEAAEGIQDLTGGRGVDIAVEALGRRETFEAAVAATRLDGTVSSVGVYPAERSLPLPVDAAFYSRRVVTSLCPSGSERLTRLLGLLEHGRTGVGALFTHTMKLAEVAAAYDIFRHRRGGVIKVALRPDGVPA
jgi:threonine dehydrogenase-like Zn-dependent dehydrogenase